MAKKKTTKKEIIKPDVEEEIIDYKGDDEITMFVVREGITCPLCQSIQDFDKTTEDEDSEGGSYVIHCENCNKNVRVTEDQVTILFRD